MAARGMSAAMAENLAGSSLADVARRAPVGVDEVMFVERKRAECGRISWQALAEMTQRNVHDLRMRCDPEYRRAHERGVAHAAPAAPVEAPKAGRKASMHVVRRAPSAERAGRGYTTCQTQVLRAIAGGARTSREIAAALNWDVYRATKLLAELTDAGRVVRRLPAGKLRGYIYGLAERARG